MRSFYKSDPAARGPSCPRRAAGGMKILFAEILVDNRSDSFHNIIMTAKERELENIVTLLARQKEYLKTKYRIREIGVFGSFVRGEQGDKSDIDILIDKDEAIGLLKLSNLQNYLSQLIGIPVDLVIKRSLHPHVKNNILDDVVYI